MGSTTSSVSEEGLNLDMEGEGGVPLFVHLTTSTYSMLSTVLVVARRVYTPTPITTILTNWTAPGAPPNPPASPVAPGPLTCRVSQEAGA